MREATKLESPPVEPMMAGAFAPAQRDTGQPKHEEDHSHNPQKMYRDADPGEQQYQYEQQ
jgi:hypothetical protein